MTRRTKPRTGSRAQRFESALDAYLGALGVSPTKRQRIGGHGGAIAGVSVIRAHGAVETFYAAHAMPTARADRAMLFWVIGDARELERWRNVERAWGLLELLDVDGLPRLRPIRSAVPLRAGGRDLDVSATPLFGGHR